MRSCQLTISNLTRERDEGKSLAAGRLENLRATYKEKINSLEQQVTDCKKTAELEVAQLKQCLLERESQEETREDLQRQLDQYSKTTALLEQKLKSLELDRVEAEKQYQKELQKRLCELDQLNGERKLQVSELSSQLEVESDKQKMLAHKNEELQEMITKKQEEYDNLQKVYNKQGKDYLSILQQCKILNEEKGALKQNQAVLELSHQLEVENDKQKILAHKNEELQELITKKEEEYNNLQKAYNKQGEDYLSIIQQYNIVSEEKSTLMSALKQNQAVAKQQQIEMLIKELEQSHDKNEVDNSSFSHGIPPQLTKEDGDNDGSRLEELRARNSICPPHLKTCYAVELQCNVGTPRSSELEVKGRHLETCHPVALQFSGGMSDLELKSVGKKENAYFEISPPHKCTNEDRQRQYDSVRRRLSILSAPRSQPLAGSYKVKKLQSSLKDKHDENKPPQRMATTRKTRTEPKKNASKKK